MCRGVRSFLDHVTVPPTCVCVVVEWWAGLILCALRLSPSLWWSLLTSLSISRSGVGRIDCIRSLLPSFLQLLPFLPQKLGFVRATQHSGMANQVMSPFILFWPRIQPDLTALPTNTTSRLILSNIDPSRTGARTAYGTGVFRAIDEALLDITG